MKKLIYLLLLALGIITGLTIPASARPEIFEIGPFPKGRTDFLDIPQGARKTLSKIRDKLKANPLLHADIIGTADKKSYVSRNQNQSRLELDISRANGRANTVIRWLSREGVALRRLHSYTATRDVRRRVLIVLRESQAGRAVQDIGRVKKDLGRTAQGLKNLRGQVVRKRNLEGLIDDWWEDRRRDECQLYVVLHGFLFPNLKDTDIGVLGLGFNRQVSESGSIFFEAGLDPVTDFNRWDGLLSLGYSHCIGQDEDVWFKIGGVWLSEFYDPGHEDSAKTSKHIFQAFGIRTGLAFAVSRIRFDFGTGYARSDHVTQGQSWQVLVYSACYLVFNF